jgi:hypothetical protein
VSEVNWLAVPAFAAGGHFVPVIAETPTSYVVGDPLVGEEVWPKEEVRKRFAFSGFFLMVTKGGK